MPPANVAACGARSPIYICTTSIQWWPKSVILPPLNSRKERKLKYIPGFQSRYATGPRKRSQSRSAGFCAGSLRSGPGNAAVPDGVDVADLPDGSGFHELLERLQIDLS